MIGHLSSALVVRTAWLVMFGLLAHNFIVSAAVADDTVANDIRSNVGEHSCDVLTRNAHNFEVDGGLFEELQLPDSDIALEACQQAVRDHPNEPRFAYQLGSVFGAMGSDEEIQWYLKAGEKGYRPAQYRIGLLYWLGTGVEKDVKEAVRWMRMSAEQGFVPASSHLSTIYMFGLEDFEIDNVEAVHWLRVGAENGHADSQYTYGQFVRQGQGVPQDECEALEWFRKAEAQGNTSAADMIKFLVATEAASEEICQR